MKKSLPLTFLTLSVALVLAGCDAGQEQDVGEHQPGERPEQEQVDTTDEAPFVEDESEE